MVSLACSEAERAARRQILVNHYKIVSHHVLCCTVTCLLCYVLPHQKVQINVTSKITTSIDVELEYLEVEYIARCWLLTNLVFSECSAWTYGLNKLSGGGPNYLQQ
jgi:hypothetical protein